MSKPKPVKWVRDGTIWGPDGTEIDIRLDPKGKHWITVKGSGDLTVEEVAAMVLAAPATAALLVDALTAQRKLLAWWDSLPLDTKFPKHDPLLYAIREMRSIRKRAAEAGMGGEEKP